MPHRFPRAIAGLINGRDCDPERLIRLKVSLRCIPPGDAFGRHQSGAFLQARLGPTSNQDPHLGRAGPSFLRSDAPFTAAWLFNSQITGVL